MKPAISFDQESEALSIKLSDKPVADSDVQDNIILDYDKDGTIVAINVYKFSFESFGLQPANTSEIKEFTEKYSS